ncbi:hypothetical protein NA56DRAFT_734646 [Hyaloscypha hepaticicola]|uniref:Glycosyltransferase family 34 protein n=1 Tax=Hyaloscypha hepaticicola TaxID=2082293 RepID=A0A2J6PLA9_9HELO|nr:hypothetical protein NA56DRAFT_734646 [Hyaloscypha hepaticicola]
MISGLATLIALCLIWSILSLDMSRIRSTVVSKESTQVALDDASKNTTTLVLYAYSESQTARPNIEFFIRDALNSAADFVFIFNGPTNVSTIIPDLPNIRIKFIILNASLRGPFMPSWSGDCWMNMYLRKLTEEVKLVGMTANCWPTFHVQSMIWATDSIGLSTLLFPPQHALDYLDQNPIPYRYSNTIHQPLGINACFHTWDSAVASEVYATSVIKAAGYKVDVLMAVVWETGWWKTNRDLEDGELKMQTAWIGRRGYSSWEFCRA